MPAAAHTPIAASGSFLISPNVGLMIWVLVVFLISLLILRRWVFPVIGKALDRRAETINGEIDAAANLRKEAQQVLDEYRERLPKRDSRPRRSSPARGRRATPTRRRRSRRPGPSASG